MTTLSGRMACSYCGSSNFHLPGCPCSIRPKVVALRAETSMTIPPEGDPSQPVPDPSYYNEVADELLKCTPEQRTRILFWLLSRYPVTVGRQIERMRREGLL